MKTKSITTKKEVGTGALILSGTAFFAGCTIGVCFLGKDGFLVGAALAIICLLIAPHLEK